jgi:hypothetical protein
MHGRTHGHLQGFQIPPPRLATGAKGNAQQLFYFARDFLLDRFDRLFSLTDGEASSTGHANLFIDIQQLLTQFPETLAFGHLTLGFGQAGRRGKCLGDGLPFTLRVNR